MTAILCGRLSSLRAWWDSWLGFRSGTNTGPSWKGPATFRSLGEQNLTLSMFYIAKEKGTWKVTHEMEMRKLF